MLAINVGRWARTLVAALTMLMSAAPAAQAAPAILPPVTADPDGGVHVPGDLGAHERVLPQSDADTARRLTPPAGDVGTVDRTAPADGNVDADGDGRVTQQATRGGGGYRSGGSYSGGRTGAVAPGAGYRTGPRTPSPGVARPAPGVGAGGGLGRAGTFFGGVAAGAILGHLFNPFAGLGWGWGAGAGFGGALSLIMSLISLAIWAALLYGAYRVIRRLFRGGAGRGGGGWAR